MAMLQIFISVSLFQVNCGESIGKHFLENVDLNSLPCDDFYKFSCGNYIKNSVLITEDLEINLAAKADREIREDLKKSLESIQKIGAPVFLQKLLTFYETCKDQETIDVRGIKDFHDLTKELGGWHLLGQKGKHEKSDWMQTLFRSRDRGLAHIYPFRVSYQPDVREAGKWIINLLEYHPFMLPSRELAEGWGHPRVIAYHSFLVDSAVTLGAAREQADKEFKQTVDFEIDVAKYAVEHDAKPEPKGYYVTIGELQRLCPAVPKWVDFLRNILSLKCLGVKLRSSTVIAVTAHEYIRKLCVRISHTEPHIMANYLFSRIAVQLSEHINSQMVINQHNFMHQHKKDLVNPIPPRWERCIYMARMKMPLAIGSLFVREVFDRNLKNVAQEIVNYIIKSFRQSLLRANWMSAYTKSKAIEKLDSMESLVAYPEEMLVDQKMNDFYKKLNLGSESSLQNYVKLSTFMFGAKLEILGTPHNTLDWTQAYEDLTLVNAHYKPRENAFVISAGILHGYFSRASNPKYVLFGGIGSVIGHEIMHGFDNNGRQLDKDGVDNNWWDANSEQNYLTKANAYWNRYQSLASSVRLEERDIGNINENIADVEGLKQAYRAYKLWCEDHPNELELTERSLPELSFSSSKQLFWITYANTYCSWQWPMHRPRSDYTHANNHLRVLGPATIIREFREDFKCPSQNTDFDYASNIW